MSRWVVLLRGVNVGGHRKIPMKRLAEALKATGFQSVQTYIQSGNVVLDSPDDQPTVCTRVAATIDDEFGFAASVIVRSVADLVDLAQSHPYDTGVIDPKLLHVVFLDRAAGSDGRARLEALAARFVPDEWSYSASGREMFVAYPNGSGTSRFTLDVIERHLGTAGTARNLNTVRRLIDLARSDPQK